MLYESSIGKKKQDMPSKENCLVPGVWLYIALHVWQRFGFRVFLFSLLSLFFS